MVRFLSSVVLNIFIAIKYFSLSITFHFTAMNPTIIVGYLSSVKLLSETNLEKWNEEIRIVLGCMDLVYALREPKPPKLTFESINELKDLYKK